MLQRVQAVFRSALSEALARMESSAGGMLASDDPEFLHQLRVGQRRLRSALRAFRPILEKKEAKRLSRAMRKLSPRLGAARDWDVLVARLERSAAPPELLARAHAKRDRARACARKTVSSRKFRQFLVRARELRAKDTGATLAELGAAALEREHRKLSKQKIDWRDPSRRHKVRIRVKRLRYSSEFFAPAFPGRRADAFIADLKALQEILGELNDIDVARKRLGAEADEAPLVRKLDAAWRRFAKRAPFW